MSRWEPAKDILEGYDRDPKHKFLHKVDSKDLQQYLDGKRPDVMAVCTKTWAPKKTGMVPNLPLCPICFPKRINPAVAA